MSSVYKIAHSFIRKGYGSKQAYTMAHAIIDKEKANKSKPLSSLFREVGNRAVQGGGEQVGEISDHYIDRQIERATNFSNIRTPYVRNRDRFDRSGSNYNPYMPKEDYNALVRFLMSNFKYTKYTAERLVKEELIANGEMPIKPFEKVNNQQRVSIVNMIAKAGLQIEGYENLDYKKALEEEKKDMYKADVKTYFKIENGEEGEKILVIERGMNKDVVAVSFAHVHYRKQGFYAGRKSSVFSESNDMEKMLINMGEVFSGLKTVLNNLLSADILTEEAYNNVMDAYEPFIFEALDYSEIEPMLGISSGLKDGRKKRISNKKNLKVKQ